MHPHSSSYSCTDLSWWSSCRLGVRVHGGRRAEAGEPGGWHGGRGRAVQGHLQRRPRGLPRLVRGRHLHGCGALLPERGHLLQLLLSQDEGSQLLDTDIPAQLLVVVWLQDCDCQRFAICRVHRCNHVASYWSSFTAQRCGPAQLKLPLALGAVQTLGLQLAGRRWHLQGAEGSLAEVLRLSDQLDRQHELGRLSDLVRVQPLHQRAVAPLHGRGAPFGHVEHHEAPSRRGDEVLLTSPQDPLHLNFGLMVSSGDLLALLLRSLHVCSMTDGHGRRGGWRSSGGRGADRGRGRRRRHQEVGARLDGRQAACTLRPASRLQLDQWTCQKEGKL
mmetsp:Transcript_24154/g.61538  ORF Transcript_24154/g.61538 Transcript_24154/m.61538 type:complete len:332 (-) Transcript_24154:567-1562(-)